MPPSLLTLTACVIAATIAASALCASADDTNRHPIPSSPLIHYHPTFTDVVGSGTAARRATAIPEAANATSEPDVPTGTRDDDSATDSTDDSVTGSDVTSNNAATQGGEEEAAGHLRALKKKKRTPTPSPTPSPAPAAYYGPQVSGDLQYLGGPVIQNVNVVPIFYAASLYQSELTSFYSAIVTAPNSYFDILTQYHTDYPAQSIGYGTMAPTYVYDGGYSQYITDYDIQAQLTAWLDAGALPQPTAAGNNYYPIHFPPGVTVDGGGGSLSCSAWCGYHSTFMYNGQYVFYGVLPDFSDSSCVCRSSWVTLENVQSVASHELFEAITDPGIGVGAKAWFSNSGGEIGDICAWQMQTVTLGDGQNYVVQAEWSDVANACTVA